jgi:hypothetical protein
MELVDLYKRKGELITLIEMAQAYLRVVNEEIVKTKPELKPEEEINKLMNGKAELHQ